MFDLFVVMWAVGLGLPCAIMMWMLALKELGFIKSRDCDPPKWRD